ncbi:MAG: PqqD family protein [Gammaproteobacteria bacterium]|nr:PqqD family protein [Gammaproteobacteria bacterium]
MDNAQYFYRKVVFTRKNNQIALADINQPDNISPLEDWMGTVISLADGIHTIQELIDYLKQQYEVAPVNLEETLHSVVERLLEGELIQLSDTKVDLPYYLALPIEQLDIEKAKQLMAEEEHNSTSGES